MLSMSYSGERWKTQGWTQFKWNFWKKNWTSIRIWLLCCQQGERDHLEWGHIVWIPCRPQEVHSGNKNGLCGHQEGAGASWLDCLLENFNLKWHKKTNWHRFLHPKSTAYYGYANVTLNYNTKIFVSKKNRKRSNWLLVIYHWLDKPMSAFCNCTITCRWQTQTPVLNPESGFCIKCKRYKILIILSKRLCSDLLSRKYNFVTILR